MKARVLVVGIALWLGVVTAGSGITWVVIDRVGSDVVTGRGAASEDPVAVPPGPTRAAVPTPSTHRSPGHSSGPRPSDRPGGGPSASASPTPGAPSTVEPSVPLPTSTSAPQPGEQAPHTQAPAQPRTVTRTWTGSSGRVTVSCTGSQAVLGSASPADGWRVEVDSRGPQQVEVTFKQGEEGAEVQVKARCSGGQPRFAVERGD